MCSRVKLLLLSISSMICTGVCDAIKQMSLTSKENAISLYVSFNFESYVLTKTPSKLKLTVPEIKVILALQNTNETEYCLTPLLFKSHFTQI